jgi:hypothetical protein
MRVTKHLNRRQFYAILRGPRQPRPPWEIMPGQTTQNLLNRM